MFTECHGHLNEGKALCPSRNTRLRHVPHALTHPIKHDSNFYHAQVTGSWKLPLPSMSTQVQTDIKICSWLYLQVYLHVSMGVKDCLNQQFPKRVLAEIHTQTTT